MSKSQILDRLESIYRMLEEARFDNNYDNTKSLVSESSRLVLQLMNTIR